MVGVRDSISIIYLNKALYMSYHALILVWALLKRSFSQMLGNNHKNVNCGIKYTSLLLSLYWHYSTVGGVMFGHVHTGLSLAPERQNTKWRTARFFNYSSALKW